jgi:hypothetical protein
MRWRNDTYIAQWWRFRASLNATGRRHQESICIMVSPRCSSEHVICGGYVGVPLHCDTCTGVQTIDDDGEI